MTELVTDLALFTRARSFQFYTGIIVQVRKYDDRRDCEG